MPSHHPTDEGYFFVRKRCSLILSLKDSISYNGHLHPCSMVVIASKNLLVWFVQQDRQVSFFIPLYYVPKNDFPPPYGSAAERG